MIEMLTLDSWRLTVGTGGGGIPIVPCGTIGFGGLAYRCGGLPPLLVG